MCFKVDVFCQFRRFTHVIEERLPCVVECAQQYGVEHLGGTGAMDSLLVGFVKHNLVPCIVNALLRHCLQPLYVALVHQFLDVLRGLFLVLDSWIIGLQGRTVTVAAYVLDGPGPDLEFPTQKVRILCVTLDKGHKDLELVVLVQLSLVHKVPKEPGALQFHKTFQDMEILN